MTPQTILYIIIAILIFEFALTKFVDYLNTLNWSDKLPDEAKWIYDEEKYKKQQAYEKTNHTFSNINSIFSFVIMFVFLVLWGFWWLDSIVRSWTENYILMWLYFFWIITLVQSIISLPFSYYHTFVIEEKFWFNKMTKKLFFTDTIKSLVLTVIIGWAILWFIIWLYTLSKTNFWIYAWIFMTVFSVFMMMFYSSLIVPLFNKQTPLEDWELKTAINDFAKKVWFKIDNIFVIDWSKRSSKANAYFSGFWPKKRIVLYDTLINDLSTKELVWVLAHEIWHYKKKHTFQMLIFSILQTWFMLFILWLALNIPEISQALWTSETQSSFWLWAIAFWILFTPISIFLWIFWNILSRKNEYEADNFAKENYDAKYLVWALKKLSKNNLSNLKPHKVYEFFHYSHPTVLKRIEVLEK